MESGMEGALLGERGSAENPNYRLAPNSTDRQSPDHVSLAE